MNALKNNSKILWTLFLGTIIAMIPEYLIRFKESVYMFFFNNFTTYPGDLWNFFANYLQKGLRYPPEYPAGLRFFYEVMGFNKYGDYTTYFTVNTVILALFALGTTYLLYLLLKQKGYDLSRLWYFWIFAPSFLFYGTINYDLPVVFLIVLSVYLFTKEKYYSSISFLAIGMVVKIFPIFLLPVLLWKAPKHLRIKLALLFGIIAVGLNVPYMLSDFNAWIFPYVWQISSNLSKGPDQGTYWWLIYPLTGKFTGWLSLILFGGLYLFTTFKMRKAHLYDLCLNVIFLFLLTDRIYSPQYNLYLLPFLVLATYPVRKKTFYFMDILNVLVVFFCFFLKDFPVFLQIFVFLRYFALIALARTNYKQCA
jgi:hypothetical protein